MRFGPGCTCCGCEIINDVFDRADGDPGDDYEIVSGSWALSGGKLECTAPGLILHNTEYSNVPGVSFHPGDSITVPGGGLTTNGDVVRLVFDYVDTDNYHFAEFIDDGGNNSVRVWSRIGGVETALAPSSHCSTLNGPFACFRADWFATQCGSLAGFFHPTGSAAEIVAPLGGSRTGIQVVAIASASLLFKGWYANRVSDDCAWCRKCENCVGQGVNNPETLQITISGLPVAGCDGTYALPLTTTGLQCTWADVFGPCGADDCFSDSELSAVTSYASGDDGKIVVTLLLTNTPMGSVDLFEWTFDPGGALECLELDEQPATLTNLLSSGNCGGPAGATCTITTL